MLRLLLTIPEQHNQQYILNCIFHEKYIEYLMIDWEIGYETTAVSLICSPNNSNTVEFSRCILLMQVVQGNLPKFTKEAGTCIYTDKNSTFM